MLLDTDVIDDAVEDFYEEHVPTATDKKPPEYSHLILEPNEGDNFLFLVGIKLWPGEWCEFRTFPCWLQETEAGKAIAFADQREKGGVTLELHDATYTQEGRVEATGFWKIRMPTDIVGESELGLREPMQVLLLALRHCRKLLEIKE